MNEEDMANASVASEITQNPLKRSREDAVESSTAASGSGSPATKKIHLAGELPAATIVMDEEEMAMQMMNEGIDPLAAGPSEPKKSGAGAGKPNTFAQDNRPQRKGKGRDNYKGRDTGFVGDGKRADGTTAVEGAEAEEGKQKEVKYPKRKVALFVGYSGTGYSGMQFQTRPENSTHSEITIEGLLFDALTKLSLISAANSTDPKKIDLQRAARTDKGVSAAGNVVSLKMVTEFPGLEDKDVLVREVNKLLPDDVKLWGYVRTLSGFNARTACDTRVYEYLFPSYMLLPPRPGCKLDLEIKEFVKQHLESEAAEGGSGKEGKEDVALPKTDTEALHPFWAEMERNTAAVQAESREGDAVDSEAEESTPKPELAAVGENWSDKPTEDQAAGATKSKGATHLSHKRQWRVGPDELARFMEMCTKFVGSHNFHNFTLFKPFNDKSVKRFILSIDVDEPKVYSGMEWISVKIHGQSFMLHQIRKMMALAMMAARTKTPSSIIPAMFGRSEIHIPKAPALGLLLENPRFGSFNARAEKVSQQNKQSNGADPISFEPYREQIEAFKVKNIYEKMREEEDKAAIYHTWVSTIDTRAGDALSYLNPFGLIPEKAIKPTKPKGPQLARTGPKQAVEEAGIESDDEGAGQKGVKADDEE